MSLLHQNGDMSVTVPATLRHAVVDDDGGQEWLSIPARAARAVERWDLVLGEPFETGMAGWTAPATTAAGADVVLKLSYPHSEARDEAAALAAWHGAGTVEVLGSDADDWALLLPRLRPGSTLRDERLPPVKHLAVGAELLRRMAAVPVLAGEPFQGLVEVADRLAVIAAERVERLLPAAPIRVDAGLCRHAVDLLRTLPGDAARRGLAHGDLNPGNILRHDDAGAREEDGPAGWLAIDPKPVHGDLAWDPWPLVTQVGRQLSLDSRYLLRVSWCRGRRRSPEGRRGSATRCGACAPGVSASRHLGELRSGDAQPLRVHVGLCAVGVWPRGANGRDRCR